MNEENPALLAARASWKAVMANDRAAWLDLMAEEICVEDPIGVAPTNPSGKGVQGKAELAEFYDRNIGPNEITIETHSSRTAGLESAHELTLRMAFDNGATSSVTGFFTYLVNESGKLTRLRGYWDMADMTFTPPTE